jgi:hypothetical protein
MQTINNEVPFSRFCKFWHDRPRSSGGILPHRLERLSTLGGLYPQKGMIFTEIGKVPNGA